MLFIALLSEKKLSIDLVAALLYSDDLSQNHGLLLQLLLNFQFDDSVVLCGEYVLIILKGTFIRPVPNLQKDLFLAESHLQSYVVFLIDEFRVVDVGFNLIQQRVHLIVNS